MEATAIVPAYNEEKTVGEVVRTLRASGEFREVVVISDGSTDRTAERARAAGATTVHELPEKRGKGAAMLHGLAHAKTRIVFFADADLKGFTVEHVRSLLEPVRKGESMMVVGLRDRGSFMTALERHLPLIGGERALRREVLDRIAPEFVQGFKIEAAMNFHCRMRHWPYGSVPLRNLSMVKKYEKVSPAQALSQYVCMFAQVFGAMLQVRVAHARGKFLKPRSRSA